MEEQLYHFILFDLGKSYQGHIRFFNNFAFTSQYSNKLLIGEIVSYIEHDSQEIDPNTQINIVLLDEEIEKVKFQRYIKRESEYFLKRELEINEINPELKNSLEKILTSNTKYYFLLRDIFNKLENEYEFKQIDDVSLRIQFEKASK